MKCRKNDDQPNNYLIEIYGYTNMNYKSLIII